MQGTLESLGTTLSQITLYDIKSMYNQAKNVVLNVSEMEAKVQEATNDEPWGASSSLMQEIANGTFNFQNFNEIMPCIYARFMEKEARQWRQIYKALQLLEYLIKHGSERVVDDARSHISTLKMLRNFHYIDERGKDEGINVRNRSKELVELLSDVEKIRAERRTAKANKHKFVGTGNDSVTFSSGGSYGGFGNDMHSSGSYGDGGNGSSYDREYGGYSGGGGSVGFRDDGGRRGFQEYNAGDDELPGSSRRSGSISRRPGSSGSRITSPPPRSSTAPTPATAAKAKEPVKVVNLLDGFDDDEGFGSTSGGKPLPTDKALPSLAAADADDDFADFVAAPQSPAPAPALAPKTTTTATKPNLMDILNATSASTSSTGASRPAMPTHTHTASISRPYAATNTNTNFGGMMAPSAPQTQTQNYGFQPMSPATRTTTTTSTSTPTTSASKPATGFDDLWTMSLASSSTTASKTGTAGKSIKDLEKEKALAGIWGPSGMGSAQKPQTPAAGGNAAFVPAGTAMGSGVDDLLL